MRTRRSAAEPSRALIGCFRGAVGAPATVQLQVSWVPGRVVAWAAGGDERNVDSEKLTDMLAAASAPGTGWTRARLGSAARRRQASALSIPVGEVLGWLVAAGAGQIGDDIGPSLRWLGRVGDLGRRAHCTRLDGAATPPAHAAAARARSSGSYSVRWTPAMVDPVRLPAADACRAPCSRSTARSTAVRSRARRSPGMVDAICRTAAGTVTVQAPPPHVRSATEVAEAFLGRLDGSAFDVPTATTDKVVAAVERWARSVTTQYGHHGHMVVQLDPPDAGDAWRLRVFTPGDLGQLVPIGQAIVTPGPEREYYEEELARLERMVPALVRSSANQPRRGGPEPRRGVAAHVRRSAPQLAAAGFDVRVPALSQRNADRLAAGVRRRRPGDRGGREPARQRRGGRPCSTTSSSPPQTSRGWRRKRAR